MSKTQSRRGGNVADRKVQYALVRRILLHWCVFVLVAGVAAMFSKIMRSDGGLGAAGFFQSFWIEQIPFLVVALFVLPIFLVDTNKLSHRFAGPMLRFRRSMRELAAGQMVEQLNFRPGDFWHDVASDFNAMLDKLQKGLAKTHSATTNTAEELVDSAH